MKVFLFFDFSELICKVPSPIFREKKSERSCVPTNERKDAFYATEAFKICYRITLRRSSFNYRFKSAYMPRRIFAKAIRWPIKQVSATTMERTHRTWHRTCLLIRKSHELKINRQRIISTGKVREITKFTSNAKNTLTPNEKTFLPSIRRRCEAKVFLAVLIFLLRRLLRSTQRRTICTRFGM